MTTGTVEFEYVRLGIHLPITTENVWQVLRTTTTLILCVTKHTVITDAPLFF